MASNQSPQLLLSIAIAILAVFVSYFAFEFWRRSHLPRESGSVKSPAEPNNHEETEPAPVKQVWPPKCDGDNPRFDGTEIDVFAIHGLNTRSEWTWTYHTKNPCSKVNWLSDRSMLPKALPRARIFTCDWQSHYLQEKRKIRLEIDELAYRLLCDLDAKRRSKQAPKERPILFIASCFGGLVLAKALTLAGDNHKGKDLGYLLDATANIVFLGTPFSGTVFRNYHTAVLSQLWVQGVITNKAIAIPLLDLVGVSSNELLNITADFTATWTRPRRSRAPRDPPYCFYETELFDPTSRFFPMVKAMYMLSDTLKEELVSPASARLHIAVSVPLSRPHVMLNKFPGEKDGDYACLMRQRRSPALLKKLEEKVRDWGPKLFNRDISLEATLKDLLRLSGPCQLFVDGLDQSRSQKELGNILRFIVSTLESAEIDARWLISSQPRAFIDQELCCFPKRNLIKFTRGLISGSIELYIETKVSQIIKKKWHHNGIVNKPLGRRISDSLKRKAAGTFLWVSLVCKVLEDDTDMPSGNEDGILQLIDELPEELEEFYRARFKAIMSRLKPAAREKCIALLATIILARRPLHLSELRFAAFNRDAYPPSINDIEHYLRRWEILVVEGNVVEFCHDTARVYLRDEQKIAIFTSGEEKYHSFIASNIFDHLQDLRKDMCNLGDFAATHSGTQGLEQGLLADKMYACENWTYHLMGSGESSGAGGSDGATEKAIHFMKEKFLHWVEAMSLRNILYRGTFMLHKLETFLRIESGRNAPGTSVTLLILVTDGCRFVDYFLNGLSGFPLQTYVSGLLFSPEQSPIRRESLRYLPLELKGLRLSAPRELWSWHSRTLKLGIKHLPRDEAPGWIPKVSTPTEDMSLLYSPDGRFLAVSYFGTTEIFDTTSAERVKTIYSGIVAFVATGPGIVLVSGAENNHRSCEIEVWDTTTWKSRENKLPPPPAREYLPMHETFKLKANGYENSIVIACREVTQESFSLTNNSDSRPIMNIEEIYMTKVADRDAVIYSQRKGREYSVYLVLGDEAPSELTPNPVKIYLIDPLAKSLVALKRDGSLELRKISPESEGPCLISSLPANTLLAALSPNGLELAMKPTRGQNQVRLYNLDWVNPEAPDLNPLQVKLSPNGRFLACISRGKRLQPERPTIRLCPVDETLDPKIELIKQKSLINVTIDFYDTRHQEGGPIISVVIQILSSLLDHLHMHLAFSRAGKVALIYDRSIFILSLTHIQEPITSIKDPDLTVPTSTKKICEWWIIKFSEDGSKLAVAGLRKDFNGCFVANLGSEHTIINNSVQLKLVPESPKFSYLSDFAVSNSGIVAIIGKAIIRDWLLPVFMPVDLYEFGYWEIQDEELPQPAVVVFDVTQGQLSGLIHPSQGVALSPDGEQVATRISKSLTTRFTLVTWPVRDLGRWVFGSCFGFQNHPGNSVKGIYGAWDGWEISTRIGIIKVPYDTPDMQRIYEVVPRKKFSAIPEIDISTRSNSSLEGSAPLRSESDNAAEAQPMPREGTDHDEADEILDDDASLMGSISPRSLSSSSEEIPSIRDLPRLICKRNYELHGIGVDNDWVYQSGMRTVWLPEGYRPHNLNLGNADWRQGVLAAVISPAETTTGLLLISLPRNTST
ncbi:hypothetical protein TWF696_001011 [Orbilia brochopaga]|uniref:Uncharacterized protein n=1 Tax=Orbilia brochopaga TaxID=3140254 RepID=A0AAV9VEM7_9PEZI